jgi:hypothetical protein
MAPATRATDPPSIDSQPLMRVTRDVPLPWLIGGALGLTVQAVVLWSGQAEQAKRLVEIGAEVRAISKTVNEGAVKNATTEYQLADIQRRLMALETARDTARAAAAVRP